LLAVMFPVALVRLLVDLVRGRETFAGLGERFARRGRRVGSDPVIWIHGASLGELTAARGLIERLRARHRDRQILITCNTYTARALIADWHLPGVVARLAPLDTPAIVSRFLGRWQPVASITLENELWPARIILCARAGIPVMVLTGRMSPRTADTWRRFSRLARRVMGSVSYMAPLDSDNGARFASLGLAGARMHPPVNLKASVRLPEPDPEQLAAQLRVFARRDTILAASTHDGEDATILAGFAIARRQCPRLRLVLAPRHPQRADQIARLIEAAGLTYSRRSSGHGPSPDDAVYLADTIGEMGLWYAASAITVVGGSFVAKGGHTPVEPVQFASLIVHGPDTSNHRQAYAALARAGAAFGAAGPDQLGEILLNLHADTNRDAITRAASAAMASLHPEQPDFDALINDLDALIGAPNRPGH
jgi:3-deoxy-D-manno-octulosonic-acid transferase